MQARSDQTRLVQAAQASLGANLAFGLQLAAPLGVISGIASPLEIPMLRDPISVRFPASSRRPYAAQRP